MQSLDNEFLNTLLTELKNSIGDMNATSTMDDFYKQNIKIAYSDLESDDIDEVTMKTELGKATIVQYATLLIKEQDVATNQTLLMLRNRLADITKGRRYAPKQEPTEQETPAQEPTQGATQGNTQETQESVETPVEPVVQEGVNNV